MQFISNGGYEKSDLWMSEGWTIKNKKQWQAPRYWRSNDSNTKWVSEFTLEGRKSLNPFAPVRHLSWFEADAYARWAGARLPTEAEWEIASKTYESELFNRHGRLWQWTASPYRPYPGFQPSPGALG